MGEMGEICSRDAKFCVSGMGEMGKASPTFLCRQKLEVDGVGNGEAQP